MLLAVFLILAIAQSPEDLAVMTAMGHADPSLTKFQLLRRRAINSDLDAVLMTVGAPPSTTLGLFLQDRHNANRVYLLTIDKSDPGCMPHPERIAETYIVVSCIGDSYERQDYRKYVFDPRAKNLLHQYRYAPFSVFRIRPARDGAVFTAGNGTKQLAIRYASGTFQVLSESDAVLPPPVEPAPSGVPPLPVTTYDQFAAARPRRVANGYKREGTELHDSIGPSIKEPGRIWFGKSFYDGEGSTGVGGFGYFDTAAKKLRLFSPPEIADYSVAAMTVTPDAVWMSLVWFGEGASPSGGLLRFDRASETVRRSQFPDVANGIASYQDQILIGGKFGIAIVQGEAVTRYFIDRTSDGRYRVVEALKDPEH